MLLETNRYGTQRYQTVSQPSIYKQWSTTNYIMTFTNIMSWTNHPHPTHPTCTPTLNIWHIHTIIVNVTSLWIRVCILWMYIMFTCAVNCYMLHIFKPTFTLINYPFPFFPIQIQTIRDILHLSKVLTNKKSSTCHSIKKKIISLPPPPQPQSLLRY